MRHPKRMCLKCNKLQFLTIRKHKKYSMYHCRFCGDEICRVGDGLEEHSLLKIQQGVDARSISEDARDSMPLTDLACANGDIMSDEHYMWKREEVSGERLEWGRNVIVSLALLTPRQQEVINAVKQHKGQKRAAKALGVTQQAVSKIMHQIRKKLEADGCISVKKGLM